VLIGSVTGILSQQILSRFVSPAVAGNMSLAVATTGTAAAHARLVHRRPSSDLLPTVLVGAPVAYGVMRAVHLLAGF
jgi:hypothetical protein